MQRENRKSHVLILWRGKKKKKKEKETVSNLQLLPKKLMKRKLQITMRAPNALRPWQRKRLFFFLPDCEVGTSQREGWEGKCAVVARLNDN